MPERHSKNNRTVIFVFYLVRCMKSNGVHKNVSRDEDPKAVYDHNSLTYIILKFNRTPQAEGGQTLKP